MNILPKSFKDFREEDYWNTFFVKRRYKAFEWYGTYLELCTILHKYIKSKDVVLVVGCGNSDLSSDLYNVGICRITNIDTSELVIKQMREKYKDKADMKWLKMDVTKMEFENEQFSVVLDKGTLDALMTDTSEDVTTQIDAMFSEIERVLKFGGRFICISLLQGHILNKLLDWFLKKGWMVRICKRLDDKSDSDSGERDRINFPVFVVVCTKFRTMPGVETGDLLEASLYTEKVKKTTVEELKLSIQALQQFAFLRHQIANRTMTDEDACFELFVEGSTFPRFTLCLVDRPVQPNNKFAIFIVPQGRETEWLFGTFPGRQQLAESAGFERLIVAHLNRNHHYDSLESIQVELSGTVMELAKSNLRKDLKVPFLSAGNSLGKRLIIQKSSSAISGDYVVEDVEVESGETFRRLVFSSAPNVIQSEARLVSESPKNTKSKRRNRMKGSNTKLKIDKTYLACQHHTFMIAGQAFIQRTDAESACRCLVLGLGGGSLTSFLHNSFPRLLIDVVELDPRIVEVAKECYELVPDDKMKVIVADGLDYINQIHSMSYDIVMVDVDNKDSSLGLSCPPKAFLEPETLQVFKSILSDRGVFVLNLVCRDAHLRAELMQRINAAFAQAYSIQVKDEVNEIVYGLKSNSAGEELLHVETRLRALNDTVTVSTGINDFVSVADMMNVLEICK